RAVAVAQRLVVVAEAGVVAALVLGERAEEVIGLLVDERTRRLVLAGDHQRDQLATRIALPLQPIAVHRVRVLVVRIGLDRLLELRVERIRTAAPTARATAARVAALLLVALL